MNNEKTTEVNELNNKIDECLTQAVVHDFSLPTFSLNKDTKNIELSEPSVDNEIKYISLFNYINIDYIGMVARANDETYNRLIPEYLSMEVMRFEQNLLNLMQSFTHSLYFMLNYNYSCKPNKDEKRVIIEKIVESFAMKFTAKKNTIMKPLSNLILEQFMKATVDQSNEQDLLYINAYTDKYIAEIAGITQEAIYEVCHWYMPENFVEMLNDTVSLHVSLHDNILYLISRSIAVFISSHL